MANQWNTRLSVKCNCYGTIVIDIQHKYVRVLSLATLSALFIHLFFIVLGELFVRYLILFCFCLSFFFFFPFSDTIEA
ncbi:hypothetical protein HOLleu_01461 [Holothuria leucospilota]|uniref:Transmembrane protein n=1 Tax=Holothuria leucospilota TaxID=206669 RepID=A0A9Q1HJ90_HOLLE|nr:hypothetical protein HOLleu_01461 [Holothuria leucospilota]